MVDEFGSVVRWRADGAPARRQGGGDGVMPALEQVPEAFRRRIGRAGNAAAQPDDGDRLATFSLECREALLCVLQCEEGVP